MNEPRMVVVPKDLYYHEVAYVRGLEQALTKAKEKLEIFYKERAHHAYTGGTEYGALMKEIEEALHGKRY
jgi:hypothetical protein